MKRIMMIAVMVGMMAGAAVADDGKVDPAKLYREKRRAEMALAQAEKDKAALQTEIVRLKEELAKRDADAVALRDAVLKSLKADEFMAKLSDVDLAKMATSDPEVIAKARAASAIQFAISQGRLQVGMTPDEADKALNTARMVLSQDEKVTVYQWKIYGQREEPVIGGQSRFGTGVTRKVSYLAATIQGRFVDGKLTSFDKY